MCVVHTGVGMATVSCWLCRGFTAVVVWALVCITCVFMLCVCVALHNDLLKLVLVVTSLCTGLALIF
jgi:hypothetical protein